MTIPAAAATTAPIRNPSFARVLTLLDVRLQGAAVATF
jgi:hypothetical protein